MTFLVQSISVFTSAMTLLLGTGVITIERAYPLTLGSSIGTTTTAILAAIANPGSTLRSSLQIALCHLWNLAVVPNSHSPNCTSIWPKTWATSLGQFSVFYLFFFFLTPLRVFDLSLAGWPVLVGVGVPIILLVLLIVYIWMLQCYCPLILRLKLWGWDFLPLCMHFLKPGDNISLATTCFQRHCCCHHVCCPVVCAAWYGAASAAAAASASGTQRRRKRMIPSQGLWDV
ncbi:Sodium-dependent phosphate transport protein 2B [Microtus ochrogaster]|uniref:Sodium-dependent phosphate transport protein 2B n=1 Tax=Microtus ochrogaster TaxID=79684 RepID=A0A8J6GPN3_MICOH|nr:Sodium-dependent phosphate transport protein 2B [Microtus ochrogaster]